MKSQVELMRINFKFEAPIIQVQIITYITYDISLDARIMEILTYFSSHSKQVNVATFYRQP